MRFIFAIACILAVGAVQAKQSIETFEEFKRVFNKQYANAEEEAIRKQHFLKSLEYVKENEYKGVRINHLSDLSLEEFKGQYMLDMTEWQNVKKFYSLHACNIQSRSVPSAIDLRQKRTVTPIRNQGGCGSCWAFSGVAATESAYLAHKNMSLDLSEQELVDCASAHGCHGDTIPTGMEYIQDTGIVSEREYPYRAVEQSCRRHSGTRYTISDYCLIYPASEDKIKQALASTNQAVSVIIGIKDLDQFRHYSGETIIRKDNGYQENWHAVNIVGYGSTQGVDYWIVRNSWSTQWGDAGYAYFEQHEDLMHITEHPYVVIL